MPHGGGVVAFFEEGFLRYDEPTRESVSRAPLYACPLEQHCRCTACECSAVENIDIVFEAELDAPEE